MTKHSPTSKGSPKGSVKSGFGHHHRTNKRWGSSHSLFQHLFNEKYGKDTGYTFDDVKKLFPKIKPEKDTIASLKSALWSSMSDSVKEEFKEVAASEKAPRKPTGSQPGVRFHEWLEEGRINDDGEELNPPENELMKYIEAR